MENEKPLFEPNPKGLIESNSHVDWSAAPRIKTFVSLIRLAQKYRIEAGLPKYPTVLKRRKGYCLGKRKNT